MPLVIKRDVEPRSALPGGGSPQDDKAYLAWRDDLVAKANARILDRHDWREDPWLVIGVIEGYRVDEVLFAATSGPLLFADRFNYSHRLRHLSNLLRDHPAAALKLATDYITATTADYEGLDA